jgi:HEAT repeat protein
MREVDDTWSTAALIEAAFVEQNDDTFASCPATVALQARGTREVLDAALTLCRSLDSKWRSLGATILGELGDPDRTFPEECCSALIGLLRDSSQEVQISALYGLGHLGNHRCDTELLAFADHPEPRIRKGVGFSLLGTSLPTAVPVLLRLMEDSYVESRDWATTTLAESICFDGPEVRAALLDRATDDDDDMTRGEALRGLAWRGDKRATGLLIDELAASPDGYYFVDAAKIILGIDEEEDVPPEALLDALRDGRH